MTETNDFEDILSDLLNHTLLVLVPEQQKTEVILEILSWNFRNFPHHSPIVTKILSEFRKQFSHPFIEGDILYRLLDDVCGNVKDMQIYVPRKLWHEVFSAVIFQKGFDTLSLPKKLNNFKKVFFPFFTEISHSTKKVV